MTVTHDERICMCAMNKIFGFKPRIALTLLQELGSAKEVFDLGDEGIDEILGPYSEFRGKLGPEALDWAESELEKLKGLEAAFVCFGEDGYPPLLEYCEDAPVGIYYKGTSPPEETFGTSEAISIVGTRDLSDYGREWCKKIVRSVAAGKTSPSIVSGLAIGTDICAHMEALECGLPTIGVMASGIDEIYPAKHARTADRMCATPKCALVTDYPVGTVPLRVNFMRRNRIIAGVSKATILIESKIKGGGMMTARLSDSYNRDTYALPGRVDDLRSQGCNQLIREQTAQAVTDCGSLMEALGLPQSRIAGDSPEEIMFRLKRGSIAQGRIGKAAKLLLEIRRKRGINLDELSRVTGLPYREVISLCSALQKDGLIEIDILQRCHIDVK